MDHVDPTSLRLSGAVPLDSLAASRSAAVSATAAATSSAYVVNVSEASFEQEVLTRSTQVPIVVDFWADWCGPCKQLSPILEKLAAEGAGSWILAKVDVDANPQLAQSAQVQGIPAVKAVVNGRAVGEFTGAMPESQVRQWIGQLLQASGNGTFGPLTGGAEPAESHEQDAVDPDLLAADDALVAGDFDASEAAYRRLQDRPGVSPELRAEARGGIARIDLLRRSESLDQDALRAAYEADPADVTAVVGLADVLILAEQADSAFALLLQFIRTSSDEPQDVARKHLIALFDVLGEDDPLVPATRRQLASALF
jgi:putative thioredoxin